MTHLHPYPNFNVTLKTKMKIHNITLAELSKETEIPISTLRKYLAYGKPCMKNWCKIMKLFAIKEGVAHKFDF